MEYGVDGRLNGIFRVDEYLLMQTRPHIIAAVTVIIKFLSIF